MNYVCVLCGNLLGKKQGVTFVDNADAGKGAAHRDCANAQMAAREAPGEFIARMVAAWIADGPERNATDLVGPAPSMLYSLADALEAYGRLAGETDTEAACLEAAKKVRKLADEERGEE